MLPKRQPLIEAETLAGVATDTKSGSGDNLPTLQTAIALAVSLSICKAGSYLTKYLGIQGGSLPAVTALAVILSTAFPKQFAYLAPSGEAMAMILMQVNISYVLFSSLFP